MIKKIITLFMLFTLLYSNVFSNKWELDLTTLSPKQLLEFYKNNPDYWKKKIGINYQQYIEGDYVVYRWEYKNYSWEPIENIAVNFWLWNQKFSYITTQKGVFNMEAKKESIKEDEFYFLSLELDKKKIKREISGKELLEKSIFHFEVIKQEDNSLIFKNLHNIGFIEWTNNFKTIEKIKKIPSKVWIQGPAIFIFSLLLIFFIGFFYYKNRTEMNKNFKAKRRGENSKNMNFSIPEDINVNGNT